MGKLKMSEGLWRFLATVLLFAVAWTMWIFYQLNPPPLIMNAAFEAAAKAKANANTNANANAGQNTQGVISPPPGPAPAITPVPVPDTASSPAPAAAPAPAEPKEPPINPDKLKFTDSLSIPDRK